MAKIQLTKYDVAGSQLDTAIELWFEDNDSVSIHTLACSAYQIIHDINSKKGSRELIYDSLLIKDEYRGEINKRLKSNYNFFKHADKDPNEIIEFDTDNSVFFIVYSCLGLEFLGVAPSTTREIFMKYYLLNHPEVITKKAKEELASKINDSQKDKILKMSKNEFYNYCIKQEI